MVYCVVVIVGVARYLRTRAEPAEDPPPVSILVHLSGDPRSCAAGLRSLFEQRYPRFEILLSVETAPECGPLAEAARDLIDAHPHIPAKLIAANPAPCPNEVVLCLRTLLPHAAHDTFAVAASGVRIEPGGLTTMVSELAMPGVALVTCPFRAISVPNKAPRFWSRSQALGLNTEFLGNLLAARLLGDINFAIGCLLALRRADFEAIGGCAALQPYFCEDLRLETLIRRRGKRVLLSRSIADRFIPDESFAESMRSRLDLARSAHRSRPAGYLGEMVTKTTTLALLLWIVAPAQWEFAVLALIYRCGAQWAAGVWLLEDRLVSDRWFLLPLEDFLSFAIWFAGLFGSTVSWRGRELRLSSGGRFEMIESGKRI